MAEIKAIKPGPKPKKDDGTDDRRRHVDPPNRPNIPRYHRIFISRGKNADG